MYLRSRKDLRLKTFPRMPAAVSSDGTVDSVASPRFGQGEQDMRLSAPACPTAVPASGLVVSRDNLTRLIHAHREQRAEPTEFNIDTERSQREAQLATAQLQHMRQLIKAQLAKREEQAAVLQAQIEGLQQECKAKELQVSATCTKTITLAIVVCEPDQLIKPSAILLTTCCTQLCPKSCVMITVCFAVPYSAAILHVE